jgi:hypothetical protein
MARFTKDCWPNTEQTYLLKAVIEEGDAAIAAWQNWTDAVDFNDIDYGSQRLIPLLYTKLMDYGIDHPKLAYYKGLYRNFWLKNQLTLKAAQDVLSELHKAEIETLLHKGIGLVLACDLKLVLRPMDDIDFIVHRQYAQRTIDLMLSLGWKTRFDYPANLDLIHAYSFHNGRGQSIDLHWYTLDTDLTSNNLEGYWQRSFPANLEGIPTRVMGATDQLIHTLVHGIRWSRFPPIRWVVDSSMLIEKSKTGVDWDHLVNLTEKLRAGLPVSQGLEYLKKEFQIAIPNHVLQSLSRIPTSRLERWEFKLSQKKRRPVLGLLAYNKKFFDYLKFHRTKFKFPGYLRYLQQMWGVKYFWQVPFVGLARVWKNTLQESVKIK